MKLLCALILIIISNPFFCQSQSIIDNADIQSIIYNSDLTTPAHIRLHNESPIKKVNASKAISTLFDIKELELEFKQVTNITKDISIEKYNRRIDGIRVPHGSYTVLKEKGEIVSLHGEHYHSSDIQKSKTLSNSEALSRVLPKLGSEMFAWESTAYLMTLYSKTSSEYRNLEKALIQDQPVGELVYVKDFYSNSNSLELAYFFTIESVMPEFRDRVYVSASDGRILLRDPQVKHGTGETRYSGTKSFPTTQINGPPGAIYELKGQEPISGIFCETKSLEGLGGLPISSPAIAALADSIADGDEADPCLIDNTETIAEFGDDEWDANEHRKVAFTGGAQSCCPSYIPEQCDEVRNDDIALDAHWGASMVARYFKDIHDRYGYDDAGAEILSYVHHGLSYENASWNGMIMKYGDGAYQDGTNPGGMFGPLVSLDVCAHEIGHAICTSTSDLVYVGESGAMNEGLSDIWAACIEGYVQDSIDTNLEYILWGIGEQIDQRDGGLYNESGARALRWMDHPPAENNPDTYGAGTWWQDPDCASPNAANDFCGVHFNSGVLNKWFYLLTEGSGQALSPGLNKPAFDDKINDKGNTYSVNGIGLNKSQKIIYGANLLLHPNSKFADMRAASIDIARSLYGPCSDEVEQTIRSWYAVGVGTDFGSCIPTIEFNQFNIRNVSEASQYDGCDASKDITLSIFSYMADETITFNTTGSAVQGEDYELCFTSLEFSGDQEQQLKITIFDDKLTEENDTIIINFIGGVYADSDTVIIINDDGIPAIGSTDVLFSDEFDENDNSWQQELVNPTSMINEWFIDAGNTNQAHISFTPTSNIPSYAQAVESDVRLKSPLINAIGRRNVKVSFKYQVGGERDLVDPSAIFDFGTFELSHDGFSWEEVETFVGDSQSGGAVPISGVYNMILPQLDNSNFYLGYRWRNDALSGNAYSFMVDSIVVLGEGLEIATEVGSEMETKAPQQSNIAFVASTTNKVISIIEDTKGDLGCTSISILENDVNVDAVPSICKSRGSKVFGLSSENTVDSILVTLLYKESEIDEWNDFTSLNILTVQDIDIDNDEAQYIIIDNSAIIITDNTDNGNGYVTYTFWTSSLTKSIVLTDRPSTAQSLIVMNSSDSEPQSFRDIVLNSCPQDTIFFDHSTDGSIISLSSGTVDLFKDVHIVGNGTSNTILSCPIDTTLNILANSTVFLKNIAINAELPYIGIKNNGQLMVSESVFISQD